MSRGWSGSETKDPSAAAAASAALGPDQTELPPPSSSLDD